MDIRLTSSALLKRIIDSVRDLCREVSLEISSDGIEIQAMDSSHVALVSLKLLARGSVFESFTCTRSSSIGLNMDAFYKAVRIAGNEDSVRINIAEQASTGELEKQIHLTFESASGERISQVDLNLMDLKSDHLAIDMDVCDAEIEIPSAEVLRALRDLKDLGGDVVDIVVQTSRCDFSTRGDIGSTVICYKPSADKGVYIKARECAEDDVKFHLQQSFALKYLLSFAKATPLSTACVIKLSREKPLVFRYSINDDPEAGHVEYFMAPKVDE